MQICTIGNMELLYQHEKVRQCIMAIQFKEIRQYLARNVRLSIYLEDGYYYDYLMISDISSEKYKDLYVYGIGMTDIEFSEDIYTLPKNLDKMIIQANDVTLEPAIEIVLTEMPRDIGRKTKEVLLFKDLKPYLQIGRHFAVINREDWSYSLYEYRREIPEQYDEMFVYGIGMENHFDESNKDIIKESGERKYDSFLNKRMVIVLANTARSDIEI